MIIVKPKPHMLICDAFYENKINKYIRYGYYTKPGLTRYVQINRLEGDTKTIDKYKNAQ